MRLYERWSEQDHMDFGSLEEEVIEELEWLTSETNEASGPLPNSAIAGQIDGGRGNVTLAWDGWSPTQGFSWLQVRRSGGKELPREGNNLYRIYFIESDKDVLEDIFAKIDLPKYKEILGKAERFLRWKNKPLYIGETRQSVLTRLSQHISISAAQIPKVDSFEAGSSGNPGVRALTRAAQSAFSAQRVSNPAEEVAKRFRVQFMRPFYRTHGRKIQIRRINKAILKSVEGFHVWKEKPYFNDV